MNIIIHCTRLMQRSHYYKERNFACFIGFTYLKNQIDTKWMYNIFVLKIYETRRSMKNTKQNKTKHTHSIHKKA